MRFAISFLVPAELFTTHSVICSSYFSGGKVIIKTLAVHPEAQRSDNEVLAVIIFSVC